MRGVFFSFTAGVQFVQDVVKEGQGSAEQDVGDDLSVFVLHCVPARGRPWK